MYLHLGQDIVVRFDEIIGIFDIETSTTLKNSREFLASAEKRGQVVSVSLDMPRSFIVCSNSDACDNVNNFKRGSSNIKVYISQISSATLKKRVLCAREHTG